MINLTDKYQTYQSNMSEGMIQLLADELNVSTDAIKALGVGFWPSDQSWIFPERNAQGEIIGLQRRKINGKKYMIEGSERGLSYILNPAFKGPKLRSGSLLEDFIRVHDAHVKCPICGRADWCLVSRDDPDNPAEVICPRPEYKTEESKQMGKAGWLHVLDKDRARPSYYQKGSSPLLPSDKPYLVIEGSSDVLAAYDLGFVGIGKPNNLGGDNILIKMVRGRRIVILGENDIKDDGSFPGKEGMERSFAILQKYSKQTSKFLPPAGVKDLRKWLGHGLTGEELLKYIDANASTKDKNLLNSPTIDKIAEQWIKENYTDGIHITLRYFRGNWYSLNDPDHPKDRLIYKEIPRSVLNGKCQKWLKDKKYTETKIVGGETVTGRKNYKWDADKVAKIMNATWGYTQITNDKDTTGPFIINGSKTKFKFDPVNHVVFENCILNIETLERTDLTPDLFRTSVLPFDYDPDAVCPLWDRTLCEWFDEGDDTDRLLQQWYGYNLLACDEEQKIMFLYGDPGTGKGTAVYVLQELLGESKCCSPTLAGLTNTHGTQILLDKYAILLTEDEIENNKSGNAVFTLFKKISGQDRIEINPKYGAPFSADLFGKITYLCNDLPTGSDKKNALRRRVIIACFNNCFEEGINDERTNHKLRAQLSKELPGIINWAIKGLRDLRKTGKFTISKNSEAAARELRLGTSSIAAMAHECLCFDDPDAFTETDQMFDLHLEWFHQNRKPAFDRRTFGKNLRKEFPDLKQCRSGARSEQTYGYRGVSIKPKAKKHYLNSPD